MQEEEMSADPSLVADLHEDHAPDVALVTPKFSVGLHVYFVNTEYTQGIFRVCLMCLISISSIGDSNMVDYFKMLIV